MAERKPDPKNDFPAPMVSKRQDRSASLNLEEVDMSKDGVQGDIAVSKGRASTFVTKLTADGSGKRT